MSRNWEQLHACDCHQNVSKHSTTHTCQPAGNRPRIPLSWKLSKLLQKLLMWQAHNNYYTINTSLTVTEC